MRNKNGKVVAKQNLPSKVCVVCHRPFTWRKKWERVWDEVTTCSKSCNAQRRKQSQEREVNAGKTPMNAEEEEEDAGSASIILGSDNNEDEEPTASSEPSTTTTTVNKKLLRQQHKQAVKAQKQERRAKRMGMAEPQVGRKPCDLCHRQVDLLVRCTTDASLQYKMVCGKCWPSVSGGVPDGIASEYPYYNYGGIWKNRHAQLKKRIGNGSSKKKKKTPSLLEEIEESVRDHDNVDVVSDKSDDEY